MGTTNTLVRMRVRTSLTRCGAVLIALAACVPAMGGIKEVDQAIARYEVAQSEWKARYANAIDQESKLQVAQERPNPRLTTQVILKEIAVELSQASSMRAIAWIYQNDAPFMRKVEHAQASRAIRNALVKHHYKQAGAGQLCLTISQAFSPQDMAFLEKVAKLAPYEIDQGMASLALSTALAELGDDTELVAKRLQYLRNAIKAIPSETVVYGRPVTEEISDQIFIIMNLSKGRVAPAFEGTDIAGNQVSLAQTRGKVTAIVFWSSEDAMLSTWLPMIGETKKILDKVGGEMIGVYTGELAPLRDQIAEREVSWTTLVDRDASVTSQYRMKKMPTIILLDRYGVIQSVGEPNSLVNLSIQALASSSE